MAELERIKELTPKFLLTILSSINRIETMITEMICIDSCREADDIYKRVEFFNYYEDNVRLQPKIEILEIILKNNHPKIFEEFSSYFDELDEIKKLRNTIAHNEVQYEGTPNNDETPGFLILHHPRIKRQKKFREKEMLDMMEKANKVSEDTRMIFKLIGKTKGLNF